MGLDISVLSADDTEQADRENRHFGRGTGHRKDQLHSPPLDPASGIDSLMDVAIRGGKIARREFDAAAGSEIPAFGRAARNCCS